MSAWVAIIIGIVAGFAGQALYWGRFEGRVLTRMDGVDSSINELKNSRSEMWKKINDHGERIAKVEATCQSRNQSRNAYGKEPS